MVSLTIKAAAVSLFFFLTTILAIPTDYNDKYASSSMQQPTISSSISNATNDKQKPQQYYNHHRHKWVGPSGHLYITVDAGGLGDFLSVQAAVESVPNNNTKNVLIKIKAGVYIEKVVIQATKPYITFQGEGKEKTIIQWHDRASDRGPNGQQLRTYRTASVTVLANFFSARNISFEVPVYILLSKTQAITRKGPDYPK